MANQKLIIGLTGGIGSGKSEVCRRFMARGITVVDADIVAREVVEPGMPALAKIQKHFGDSILVAGANHQPHSLNRAKLREIIFNDPAEKAWLEQLLHPLISQQIRMELQRAASAYIILASPLLLETQQYRLVHRVLVVDTTEQQQIERASLRDSNSEAQIKAIMHSQLSRQNRCARANDIIQNHGDLCELDEQVEKLHRLYLELTNKV